MKSDEDSVIVVAGAGSGKTITILGKIQYLIKVKKIKEEEILCISFTNETVKSLVNKLNNMNYSIDVFTFHKLSLNILKNNNYKLVNDNYLDYIVDEYFESFIKYNNIKVKLVKRILFSEKNINKLYKTKDYINLKKTIVTFIKLAKSNNYKIKNIFNIYRKTFFNEKIILKIILDIYTIYERELESIKQIDFDDMISKAIAEVKYANLKYKYIIIDEFQDTSLVRYDLIKEIIKYTNAKIFVVGDDWQSIYRFSGCNLDLFVRFNKYFNNAKYHYLTYTYRNSSELIYVSSHFIMKNRRQLKKKILSIKKLAKPIVILFNYGLEDIFNLIDDKENILIIGRNNADIKNIKFENKLTIHRSKGLESKNVILINSDSIPSTIKNERILRHVLPDKDYVMFEEERRLFYVALTRTKKHIYIQVNTYLSPFVKELMKDYKDFIEIKKK